MKKFLWAPKTELLIFLILIFSAANLLTSCSTRIAYFKDLPVTPEEMNGAKYVTVDSAASYPLVKTDDILNINILTIDPTSNRILNQGNIPILVGGSLAGNGSQSAVNGYLVNKDGYIKLPFIDTVYVRGLATDAIRDTIKNRLNFYFKNTVVSVRFANFRVSVLGQVERPASYIMANEKPTIFDAIGMAGDMTLYGRRDNVMLIRDNDYGKKEVMRVDLDSTSALKSSCFYLRPNDVIYIEPTNSAVVKSNNFRDLGYKILESAIVLSIVIIAHRSK